MSPYGVWVKSTHLEWKDGPYAKQGVKCHDCHMTYAQGKTAAMGNTYPDARQHLFHGAHDPGKVRGTIELRIHPDVVEAEPGDPVRFTVALFNQKTGHKFPSGSVEDRIVWMHVEAVDAKGTVYHLPVDKKGFAGEEYTIGADTLAYQDMGIALNDPGFKGIQRDGIPVGDRIFRMAYFDPQGRMTIQQWNTKSLGTDYRIGPRETKLETCTFRLPDGVALGELKVTAVLNYQKLVKPVGRFPGRPGGRSGDHRGQPALDGGQDRRLTAREKGAPTMKHIARLGVVTLLLAAAGLGSLQAMPAFARKYSMSCKTCHAPFPKLKPYGEEFAGNGFVIKDKATPRDTVDTGDPLLSLLRDIPIALRLEGFLAWNNANQQQVDFLAPYLLKFLSGGAITKDIAYYFYFFFSERGEVAGVEDAFVMFNDLFGSELDLYVGQFQVSDPLFKREVRLPFEDYQIYRATPGDSGINLTYDRGIMLTYGFATGTDVTFEVLNGTGIGEANVFRNFDVDPYKNVLLRVSQEIAPAFRIGAFGYTGKERPEEIVNSVWMAGGDATIAFKPFELNVQYVERRDSNPYFALDLPADKVMTRGGFAELIYLPRGDDSRWYGAGLFNWVESDLDDLDYTGGHGPRRLPSPAEHAADGGSDLRVPRTLRRPRPVGNGDRPGVLSALFEGLEPGGDVPEARIPVADLPEEREGPVPVVGGLGDLRELVDERVVLFGAGLGFGHGRLQPFRRLVEIPLLPVALADEAVAGEGQRPVLGRLGQLLDGLGEEALAHEGQTELVVDIGVGDGAPGLQVLPELGDDRRELPFEREDVPLELAGPGRGEPAELPGGRLAKVVILPLTGLGADEGDDVRLGEDVGRADLLALEDLGLEQAGRLPLLLGLPGRDGRLGRPRLRFPDGRRGRRLGLPGRGRGRLLPQDLRFLLLRSSSRPRVPCTGPRARWSSRRAAGSRPRRCGSGPRR